MRSISYPRTAAAGAVIGAVMLGSALVAVSDAASGKAPAKPPKTVTATLITRRSGTLSRGTSVRASKVGGHRAFTDAKHGFGLASVGGADYPVATVNAGKTWKTDGPALHLHALQAPLAVVFIGAVNRRTVFAWGGGQVIDATSDGGQHWYRALFTLGAPVAVVPELSGHLLAFVGSFTGNTTWQYASTDGGRTWTFKTTVAH